MRRVGVGGEGFSSSGSTRARGVSCPSVLRPPSAITPALVRLDVLLDVFPPDGNKQTVSFSVDPDAELTPERMAQLENLLAVYAKFRDTR